MTTPVAPPGEASTFHHLIGGDFSGKLRRARIDNQPAGGVPGET